MVKAWDNMTDINIRHAWENLIPEDKPVSPTNARILRQEDLLADTLTSITAVSAPGFREVVKDDIMKELVGEKSDASETVTNLINDDVMDDEPEMPVTQSEPPSLTIQKLSVSSLPGV